MNKILLIILLAFLSVGCAVKKNKSHEFKQVSFDSISYKKTLTITPAIHDTLVIESPCDSLGRLKPISAIFNSGRGKITLNNVNGNLKATIAIDSIKDTTIDKSKVSTKDTTTNDKEEVVRTNTDYKMWILLIISIALNVMLIINKIRK